jgi:RHS repeat-associated protein
MPDNLQSFPCFQIIAFKTHNFQLPLQKPNTLLNTSNKYNHGFRQLDPQLCRWHVADALAEKYTSVSPYAYALNDPINNIDIMGLWSYSVYVNGVYSHSVRGSGNTWEGAENYFDENYASGGGSDASGMGGSESGGMGGSGSSRGSFKSFQSQYNPARGNNHFFNFLKGVIHWLFQGIGDNSSQSDEWNPSDPSNGHFASDFKTLVNYMYENSPKEKREFAAWVLEKDGKEYYYLENRDDSSPCECWPTFQGNGKVAIDLDGDGIKELSNIIVGIHTHNSCLKSDGYQGPSDIDYSTAQDFKANSIIIGDTEISVLYYKMIYNTPNYFYHLRDQKGPLFENPFKVDNTHDWLLNPTYKY